MLIFLYYKKYGGCLQLLKKEKSKSAVGFSGICVNWVFADG